MKLLRYGTPGNEQPGLLDNDGNIRSLTDHISDINGSALTADALAQLDAIDVNSLPLVEGDVRIGACVGNIGKFICIGLNYADHAAETGAPIPEEPVVFMKATSSVMGPNDTVVIPRNSEKTDWEVELAMVIGKETAYVSEEEAADCIAGYFVCNDVSEREFQLERSGQWDLGKGCDTFGPIGPYLVTADEAGDISNLGMWLDVNGHRYQNGNTSTMIFNPAFIVSFLSQYMSLQPGDVISTGTPPGVGLGQKPPVYLQPGDVIELGIEGLGSQKQTVV
ncbi:MAG: fumarylacetoacetate hydrolase family protein, partial [Porticoccaceae bacterium]|nr:fumarylacetoacetate hydrolase family protein [Porticoccaceae bacterium]